MPLIKTSPAFAHQSQEEKYIGCSLLCIWYHILDEGSHISMKIKKQCYRIKDYTLYIYIYKLNRTVLQFLISNYLNQAHKVPVITCDKIINIVGFQQFSSTAFTCGQPCTAERELLLLKVPQCFLLPLCQG